MSEDLVKKRQELMQSLGKEEDAYLAFLTTLAPEKRQRIRNSLNSMKHGLHAVAPITCRGPKSCPFINHCPIPSVEQKQSEAYGPDTDYPVMMPCVLETMYQRQKILEYYDHLDVDPDNPVEVALVNELAILDLHKNRALMVMSEGDRDGDGRDFLKQDIDWKEAGDEAKLVKTTSLHPTFEVLDKLERRRERLLERLIQTRKIRAELDIKQGATHVDSNVLKEIQKVRDLLQQAAVQAVDEEQLLLDD